MVDFHGKPLCFCGSGLQTGSQFLQEVQDNIIRGLWMMGDTRIRSDIFLSSRFCCVFNRSFLG